MQWLLLWSIFKNPCQTHVNKTEGKNTKLFLDRFGWLEYKRKSDKKLNLSLLLFCETSVFNFFLLFIKYFWTPCSDNLPYNKHKANPLNNHLKLSDYFIPGLLWAYSWVWNWKEHIVIIIQWEEGTGYNWRFTGLGLGSRQITGLDQLDADYDSWWKGCLGSLY